ncbi:glycoside hydrolase family 3 N-terminal domain-containing protein [Desulfatirhabdium butyrativorans]|uniref:glycoside hydrolase family 3 N-terminal domain-containing protein n=1 Tax=Desulfatirhabdium butyrativorans TaxID=340467 RepID=UPI0004094E0A|nr:glycoside hydrolase family 3 N-terminal domain-containing protein [Desulfatirhabdium butyrativorans]
MTIPAYQNPALPVAERIEDLLGRMTIEEKAGQLNQWFNLGPDQYDMVRRGEIGSGLMANSSTAGNNRQERVFARAVNEIQKIAVTESRLGIPLIFGRDVIHGYRTVAPIPLGMAAAWSPELIRAANTIAAKEARADGIHWGFSPMLDIARDPRWGRVAEGFGEDPFLAGKLAAAAVSGFQGNDQGTIPQQFPADRIVACAKHFVGYGAAEGGRDYNTTEITRHTLHNIYLAPFKAAIQSGCATVMSAFHDIGGVPLSAHRYLLDDVLKKQWEFGGFIVSDWGAVGELVNHGIAADGAHAAELACNAGVDMDMCVMVYLNHLPDLVRAGKVSETRLNDAVTRILRIKFALGLFENPYADPNASQAVHLLPESLATMRRLAAESMVLLKNNGVLPLPSENVTICLSGPLADQRQAMLGCWAPDGQPEEVTTLKEAIAGRLGTESLLYHVDLSDDAVKLARSSDVLILAIGESAGRSGEDNCTATIDLPAGQEALLESARRMEIPIVAVVFGGRPLNLTRVMDWADAVLFAWHPGITGGLGVADVLFGDVNPSGRLPITFPRSTGQIPLYYNHRPTGRPMPPHSRRYSRYVDSLDSPLFPFGFGLSYTTFEFANLQISQSHLKPEVSVTVEITNTGNRAGTTVAQCYVRDIVARVARPVRELKGFERVFLDAGETRTVQFTLGPHELSYLDDNGNEVLEPGRFQVWVGPDSNAELGAEFEITPNVRGYDESWSV